MFRKILKSIYKFIRFIFIVNWSKTLYVNFKTQSFFIALKLPIVIYGKLKIYSLKGGIEIKHPISFGMIHFGKDIDHNPVSLCPVKLNITGSLIFYGDAIISGGSTITVWSGKIEIHKNVFIASGVQLKCVSNITIGQYTRVAALTTIMDTNVHFVKNIETGEIKRNNSPIIIGKNCWLNQGSIVTKGTIIPDYCISSRNSFLNKDYSKICSSNTLLSGAPAKPIAYNVQRIFDNEKEKKIKQYFMNNPEENIYVDTHGYFVEPDEIHEQENL